MSAAEQLLNLQTGIILHTLKNSVGTQVIISNYGAIITSFRVKTIKGNDVDIVLGFEKMSDYLSPAYLESYPWFGAAIGRYANRIGDAAVHINNKKYLLNANEGRHQLHGGFEGFDKRTWQVTGSGHKPIPFLELQYISPDGEEGFPGTLVTNLRFELNDDNELSYEYKAVADEATCVNLTHHDYFNLDGEGTIARHKFRIPSSHFLEQDEQLITTGKKVSVNATPYDFRVPAQLDKGILETGGYDKSFVIAESNTGLVAEAQSELTGITLQVYSTEPVVHFYAGKWIPVIRGKENQQYGPFSGFCFETQAHPNAVNIAHFPDTILLPGQTYYQKTVYKVSS